MYYGELEKGASKRTRFSVFSLTSTQTFRQCSTFMRAVSADSLFHKIILPTYVQSACKKNPNFSGNSSKNHNIYVTIILYYMRDDYRRNLNFLYTSIIKQEFILLDKQKQDETVSSP